MQSTRDLKVTCRPCLVKLCNVDVEHCRPYSNSREGAGLPGRNSEGWVESKVLEEQLTAESSLPFSARAVLRFVLATCRNGAGVRTECVCRRRQKIDGDVEVEGTRMRQFPDNVAARQQDGQSRWRKALLGDYSARVS